MNPETTTPPSETGGGRRGPVGGGSRRNGTTVALTDPKSVDRMFDCPACPEGRLVGKGTVGALLEATQPVELTCVGCGHSATLEPQLRTLTRASERSTRRLLAELGGGGL